MLSPKQKLYKINFGSNWNPWSQIVQYVNRYIFTQSLVVKTNDSNPTFPSQFIISVASNEQTNQYSDDFFVMEDIRYFNCFYTNIEPIYPQQKEARQKELETGSMNSIFIPSYYNDINQVLPIHFINFFLYMYAFRDFIKIDKDFHKTGKFLFDGKEMSVKVNDGVPLAGIELEVRKEIFRQHPMRTIGIYLWVYYWEILLLTFIIGPVLYSCIKYAMGVFK